MKSYLSDDANISNLILEKIKMGWWRKDDEQGGIVLSNFVQDMIGTDTQTISYEYFISMVREDYRERILRGLLNTDPKKIFDEIFPLEAPNGLIWVHAKGLYDEKRGDYVISTGSLQQIEDPELSPSQRAASSRVNNLLFQLNNISHILLSFLESDNPDEVINRILKDLLKQFKGGRAYIFEYDWPSRTQTNTYEIVDQHIKPAIDMLSNLSLDMNAWWTQQMISRQPIVLSTLDDLPEEAAEEKEFLALQEINSLLVAPLISKDGVWGYAGIDIVSGFHQWSDDDCEWTIAMINIISICIQLLRSKKTAQLDRSYLQNLYNNMPLGYMRVHMSYDKEGQIIDFTLTDANKATDELFSQPMSSSIGCKASEAILDCEKVIPIFKEAIRNKGNYETDYYSERSNKHIHLVLYSIQENELVCLMSDITEAYHTNQKLIKAKEKAEVSDRLKSAFLANMSHEIRTPLNAIVGFSDLMSETDDKEERQQYYKLVSENNELLLQLISDILDISKIEAGTLDIIPHHVDVNLLCREIVRSYELKTKSREVKITFDESIPSCILYGDKYRITQIINNFINNALKFTEKGSISLGYRQEGDSLIKFYVRDTGTGIEKGSLDQIFERFVKLNSFVKGTGLGLSICKSLAEQMGGSIGVESEVGVGSCFWFTHPYRPNEQNVDKVVKPSIVPQIHIERDRIPTILVAEDTESNYILLTNILRKGYKLIRAKNGLEVVELFKESRPDLILMDIKMPYQNGIEATKIIRSMDKEIPIIAVTAFAFDSDKERALSAGCNAYISKPFQKNDLLNTINEMIDKEPS